MKDSVTFNIDDWNIKHLDRTRNRMKLQLKFNKEEALAIKNFLSMVKPPEISDDEFFKGIFKIGIETMEMKLMEAVKAHAEENNLDSSSVGLEKAPKEVSPDEVQAD